MAGYSRGSNSFRFSTRSYGNQTASEDGSASTDNDVRKPQQRLFAQAVSRSAAKASRQQRHRQMKRSDELSPSTFVTAYCVAEAYDIDHVTRILEDADYQPAPIDTNLALHVVHFLGLSNSTAQSPQSRPNDVFILATGTVVVWGTPDGAYVSDTLLPMIAAAAKGVHVDGIETEDLEFCEDPRSDSSHVNGDIITLGTRLPNASPEMDLNSSRPRHTSLRPIQQQGQSLLLTKVAFSFGLARSTKVAILESELEHYFASTGDIPVMLKSGTKLPYSRRFVLQKTGELLSMRSHLNLSSELTDSLPNVFWDSRYELGLEECFVQVSRALDIGVRIRALNEKMTYAQEIASVLQERLSERHGFMLEWLIIALISFEICIEITRLVKERFEHDGPDSLESLLRRYIELDERERRR